MIHEPMLDDKAKSLTLISEKELPYRLATFLFSGVDGLASFACACQWARARGTLSLGNNMP